MSSSIDEVGQWSVDKLDILSKYLLGYTTVLRNFPDLKPIYIDAFASSGLHTHRENGEFVEGSPLRALKHGDVFRHFHFIDVNQEKVDLLKQNTLGFQNLSLHCGDCNRVVVDEVLPLYPYEKYYRILSFVDPYGMHVSWELIEALGKMKGTEMFLNFPIADINRNALHRSGANPNLLQQQRLTRLWGDETWKSLFYETAQPQMTFSGEDEILSLKADNQAVVKAFRKRLKEKAGFTHVPEAAEVCGLGGNVIYFLIFAGHNEKGAKIANNILGTYRNRRR